MEGQRLGPYRISRELGSGGMGRVYAAVVTDPVPGLERGVTVAIKLVHPHLLQSPGFFRRFLREAELGASIQHENVVRTYLCDQLVVEERHHSFLVTEFVEGQDLRGLMQELERLPEELSRHIGREVARGLAAIHAAGAVHRDLKPENVLITASHQVKVMDLGVARLVDEQVRLSQSGAFVGSIEYAAPEQFSGGDKVDSRSDLHALGLLLYELASGQHPYRSDDAREVMKRICEVPPRRLGEVNPQLSPFFEEVVHTLLAKEPCERFGSAAELLEVLEQGEESVWWHERARALRATTRRPLRRVRIPRETAIHGRDAELEQLLELFARSQAGDGQVLLVEGEAGIGKSRLVDELVGRLQASGEDLTFLFGSYPPGGAATAAGAFSTAYREQLGEEGSAPYLEQTPLLVPAFDALLRGDATPTGAVPLNQETLATCFVNLTRALAAERPTLVLIDDLHFAPVEGRALFSVLAQAVPGHRILLVGTFRPGVPREWTAGLAQLGHTTRMSLGRLGARDLAGLLRECFGSEHLAHTLGMQIAEKSDGNPFFVFEIIRGLREGQFITRREDGTWVATGVIEEIQIPSSVLELVGARVAGLTEAERDILDVACCCGFEFDPLLVGAVLGHERIPVLKALGQIERQHRLVRSSGLRYVFDHHQVQEALYDSLSELLRREYHAELARKLEEASGAADCDPMTLDGTLTVQLCEHFLKGNRGERALHYLSAAHRHLLGGAMHAQAVALGERALAAPNLLTGSERARVLLRLCRASGPLDQLGRHPQQLTSAEEALSIARAVGDVQLERGALHELGAALTRVSRLDEAETALSASQRLAAEQQDVLGMYSAILSLGVLLTSQGRFDESLERLEHGMAMAREAGDRWCEMAALVNLGTLHHRQRHVARGVETARAALEIAHELGDRHVEGVITCNLSSGLLDLGELLEARELAERGLDLARRAGDRNVQCAGLGGMAVADLQLGRVREARESAEAGVQLARELGHDSGIAEATVRLGRQLWCEGDDTGAERCYVEGLTLHERAGNRYERTLPLLWLGAVRAQRTRATGEDAAAARELLEEARDLAIEFRLSDLQVLARCALALLPGGDPQDAVRALEEHGTDLDPLELIEARLRLWQATGETAHLQAACQDQEALLSKVTPQDREAMCAHFRLHRELRDAIRRTFESGDASSWRDSETVAD